MKREFKVRFSLGNSSFNLSLYETTFSCAKITAKSLLTMMGDMWDAVTVTSEDGEIWMCTSERRI